jgi:peptidoglycan/LPS O-acetylase OafA/YrhL
MLFAAVRIWPLKKAAPIIITLVFLFSNAVRIYSTYQYGILTAGADAKLLIHMKILTSVPARIDNIIFGMLGAYLSFFKFRLWTNYKNILFAIGLTGFLFNHFCKVFSPVNLYSVLIYQPIELLFILMTFPRLSTLTNGKGAIARLITFTSKISYSIYLIHMSIFMYAVRPRFPYTTWILLPVYYIWAFGGGYLLYITVEKWGLKFRDKLRQRDSFSKN